MAKILITGSARGIGLELARQLAERGDDVVGVCRRESPELAQLPVRVIDGIDVADGETIRALAHAVADERLDVVINNDGILTGESLDDLDLERMRAQYEVNALGPLRVTHALLPMLTSGSKVAIISSRVGSLGDNSSGGNYGYRMSKAAANMAGVNLAIDLRARGIIVGLLHPGLVATDMTGGQGVSPAHSAAGLIRRIDAWTMAQTGSFQHAEGEVLPW